MKAKQTKKRAVKLRTTFSRHLKLTFLPHKANQYRPHLTRRYGLVGVLIAIVVLQAGYNFATSGVVLGEYTTVTAETLLANTNNERAKAQLTPLKTNEQLSRAAYLKAKDMLQQQYWAHTAPNGTTPWQWFSDAGYNYSYAGENLAKNFHTTESVTAAWLSSPEHRANVLGKQFSEVGFAVVEGALEGKEATLVVALYGAPAKSGAVAGMQAATSAPVDQPISPVARLGVAVKSMTPAVLGSIVLLLVVALVAVGAHAYRNKLPKTLRQSWYRHHGLIKVGGVLSLCLVFVFLYSGGQI